MDVANDMVCLAQAAVQTRRPQLLKAAASDRKSERQLLELIESLLQSVIVWEDYSRRVEFTMECLKGDAIGFMRKVSACQQGRATDKGDGFEPVNITIEED